MLFSKVDKTYLRNWVIGYVGANCRDLLAGTLFSKPTPVDIISSHFYSHITAFKILFPGRKVLMGFFGSYVNHWSRDIKPMTTSRGKGIK